MGSSLNYDFGQFLISKFKEWKYIILNITIFTSCHYQSYLIHIALTYPSPQQSQHYCIIHHSLFAQSMNIRLSIAACEVVTPIPTTATKSASSSALPDSGLRMPASPHIQSKPPTAQESAHYISNIAIVGISAFILMVWNDDGQSIDVLDHDCVEVLKRYLAVFVGISLLQHQQQRLLVQVFLDVAIDLLEVVDGQEVLVVAIVLLEDSCDFLLAFAAEGLGVHRLHEFDKADAAGLLCVELCHDLVGGLSVGVVAVLGEQQFEVIGQKHSHARGVVGIEDFLEVDHVLVGEAAGDVEACFELPEVFPSEPDAVDIGPIDSGFALFGTVAKLLTGVPELAVLLALEGAGALLVSDLFHRHA